MRNTGKDMSDFAWALIGPGRIAHRFADAVHRLPGAYLRSVFGRDATRAAEFARHWTRVGKPPPRVEPTLAALLARCADIDRLVKGLAAPKRDSDPWLELGDIALACAAGGTP